MENSHAPLPAPCSEPWGTDVLDDYWEASDEDRRQMLLNSGGYDPSLCAEVERLFPMSDSCEDAAPNDDKECNDAFKKVFQFIKAGFKYFWVLFCALGTIVTVFGWPRIFSFFRFLCSLFQ